METGLSNLWVMNPYPCESCSGGHPGTRASPVVVVGTQVPSEPCNSDEYPVVVLDAQVIVQALSSGGYPGTRASPVVVVGRHLSRRIE